VREIDVRIEIRKEHSFNKNYKFHDLIELVRHITRKLGSSELKRMWNARFVTYLKAVLVFEGESE
jgi:hypothetical protein